MSGGSYRRATKKHPTRVEHIYGDATEGYLLVPVGSDFSTTIAQIGSFMAFELKDGEETYINVASIKRVTETGPPLADANAMRSEAEERASARASKAQEESREAEGKARQEREAKRQKRRSPYSSPEEYDALDVLGLGEYATRDEIQAAYRRLVKLYHPDRLRGLGVSDSKIAYAEERLADINNAYRLLLNATKAA